MAGDHFQLAHRLLQIGGRAERDELVAGAVKTIAADLQFLADCIRQRVGVGLLRHVRVEGGVENGHLGRAGDELLHPLDPLQIEGIVQRRQRNQFPDGGDDLHVHLDGVGKLRSAVDDAMPHRFDIAQVAHARVRLVGDRRNHHIECLLDGANIADGNFFFAVRHPENVGCVAGADFFDQALDNRFGLRRVKQCIFQG